jgi:hypothetical protein
MMRSRRDPFTGAVSEGCVERVSSNTRAPRTAREGCQVAKFAATSGRAGDIRPRVGRDRVRDCVLPFRSNWKFGRGGRLGLVGESWLSEELVPRLFKALQLDRICFFYDVWPVLVLEPVEYPRLHESSLGFLRVGNGGKLKQDEDVVRVVDASKDSLALRLLARLGAVLLEHRAPRVVVTDLDPGDDECGHTPAPLVEYGDDGFDRDRDAGCAMRGRARPLPHPPSGGVLLAVGGDDRAGARVAWVRRVTGSGNYDDDLGDVPRDRAAALGDRGGDGRSHVGGETADR